MCAAKIEFGDFQTPLELSNQVVKLLSKTVSAPHAVVEPTCGEGNFLLSAIKQFSEAKEFHGFEINPAHVAASQEKLEELRENQTGRIELADFFLVDWQSELRKMPEPLLIVGNPPWVTNSAQSVFDGTNLPIKSNIEALSGFQAISGSSNFDISESMLRSLIESVSGKTATLAMLVKTSVARKVLAFVGKKQMQVLNSSVYELNSFDHFGVSVDACLLVIGFSRDKGKAFEGYELHESITEESFTRIYWDGARFSTAERRGLDSDPTLSPPPIRWRSGVKHDASKVMELKRKDGKLFNGFGLEVDVEQERLFPMFKGSDVAGGKPWSGKFLIVPQNKVGQDTEFLSRTSPKLYEYLVSNSEHLDSRKSSIYRKKPRFSVFGVGDYTFKPWKIAIGSLYKKLHFQLFSELEGKPVVFDDTVYFIGFDTESEAREVLSLLEGNKYQSVLGSLIFWDEKRPIKTSVLNQVNWNG